MTEQLPVPVLAEGERLLAVGDIIEIRVHQPAGGPLATTLRLATRGERPRVLLVSGERRNDLILGALLDRDGRERYATEVAKSFGFGIRREWKDEDRDWFHLIPKRG